MTWSSLIHYFLLGLAAAVILAAIFWITLKAIDVKIEEWRQKRRAHLVHDFVASLDETANGKPLIKRIKASPRIASEIFVEFALMIWGRNLHRLLNIARTANLTSWLNKQLQSGTPQQRRMAAETLRFFDDEKTVAALRHALDDPDMDIRMAAALSLTEIGRAPQLSELLQKLSAGAETHPMQLRQIFQRMADLDRQGILDLALRQKGSFTLRCLAIEALGAMSTDDISPILHLLAQDAHADVRKAAIAATTLLDPPDAAKVISVALSDENWEVRLAAIKAAKHLDLVEAANSVSTLVNDDIWWVRLHAVEAMLDLGELGLSALKQIKALENAKQSTRPESGNRLKAHS